MLLLDRYILVRFLANFAILFALLFIFAVAIDVIVALDRFVEATRRVAGEDAGTSTFVWTLLKLAADFQAPRFFQFYAYLHGMVAVGAMGFTLAQMYRHKELVAMLAAGISLPRVAMPFIVAIFGLSAIQLVNQEVFLPRVAPLLLRDHAHIGRRTIDEFDVPLTPDSRRSLFQATRFRPEDASVERLTILERDDRGRTMRRVTAARGTWEDRVGPDGDDRSGWRLEGGRVVQLRDPNIDDPAAGHVAEALDFYASDLSPKVLLHRRHGQYATMLSLSQIGAMLDTPDVADRSALLRYRYQRFATVLLNVLVMWLAMPTFLLREPANLLLRTVTCAAVTIPVLLGSAIVMMMDLPGIAPAVGVFLPVIVLIPVVLAQWTYVKT